MKYRLIVFDWEGTLSDTLGQIVHILLEEARKLNLKIVDVNEARQAIVHGLNIAVEKLFPDINKDMTQKLLQAIQQTYVTRPNEEYLIPGALEFVEMLKDRNIKLAIATNRNKSSLIKALKSTDLEDYFSLTRCHGECPPKPSPVMLNEIMEVCNIQPKEVLMIGDSVSDITMANIAKVDAIGVNFYDEDDIKQDLMQAGAITVVDDYQDLVRYLKL